MPLTEWLVDKPCDLSECRHFHLLHGVSASCPAQPPWRVVVSIRGTEDIWALRKSLPRSSPVVFYYLVVTSSPVGAGAGAGATRWLILEPGDILGNNQYKMHWVGATIRLISLDSVLFDRINNSWEKRCKNLQEGKAKCSWGESLNPCGNLRTIHEKSAFILLPWGRSHTCVHTCAHMYTCRHTCYVHTCTPHTVHIQCMYREDEQ